MVDRCGSEGNFLDDDTFHLAEGAQGVQSTGNSGDGRLVEDGSLVGIWTDCDKTRALPFEVQPVEAVTARLAALPRPSGGAPPVRAAGNRSEDSQEELPTLPRLDLLFRR